MEEATNRHVNIEALILDVDEYFLLISLHPFIHIQQTTSFFMNFKVSLLVITMYFIVLLETIHWTFNLVSFFKQQPFSVPTMNQKVST